MQAKPLGMIGAAVVIFGVFCPVISLPIAGSMNLFANGKGDVWFILVSVGVFVFCLSKRIIGGAWAFSVLTGCFVLTKFAQTAYMINDMTNQLAKEIQGNPFSGIFLTFASSINLQWGWAVLLIGTCTMFYACKQLAGEQNFMLNGI